MNRTFRIIWNEARHLWQYVSELTRSRTKRSRTQRAAALVALSAIVGLGGTLSAANAAETPFTDEALRFLASNGFTVESFNTYNFADRITKNNTAFYVDKNATLNFTNTDLTYSVWADIASTPTTPFLLITNETDLDNASWWQALKAASAVKRDRDIGTDPERPYFREATPLSQLAVISDGATAVNIADLYSHWADLYYTSLASAGSSGFLLLQGKGEVGGLDMSETPNSSITLGPGTTLLINNTATLNLNLKGSSSSTGWLGTLPTIEVDTEQPVDITLSDVGRALWDLKDGNGKTLQLTFPNSTPSYQTVRSTKTVQEFVDAYGTLFSSPIYWYSGTGVQNLNFDEMSSSELSQTYSLLGGMVFSGGTQQESNLIQGSANPLVTVHVAKEGFLKTTGHLTRGSTNYLIIDGTFTTDHQNLFAYTFLSGSGHLILGSDATVTIYAATGSEGYRPFRIAEGAQIVSANSAKISTNSVSFLGHHLYDPANNTTTVSGWLGMTNAIAHNYPEGQHSTLRVLPNTKFYFLHPDEWNHFYYQDWEGTPGTLPWEVTIAEQELVPVETGASSTPYTFGSYGIDHFVHATSNTSSLPAYLTISSDGVFTFTNNTRNGIIVDAHQSGRTTFEAGEDENNAITLAQGSTLELGTGVTLKLEEHNAIASPYYPDGSSVQPATIVLNDNAKLSLQSGDYFRMFNVTVDFASESDNGYATRLGSIEFRDEGIAALNSLRVFNVIANAATDDEWAAVNGRIDRFITAANRQPVDCDTLAYEDQEACWNSNASIPTLGTVTMRHAFTPGPNNAWLDAFKEWDIEESITIPTVDTQPVAVQTDKGITLEAGAKLLLAKPTTTDTTTNSETSDSTSHPLTYYALDRVVTAKMGSYVEFPAYSHVTLASSNSRAPFKLESGAHLFLGTGARISGDLSLPENDGSFIFSTDSRNMKTESWWIPVFLNTRYFNGETAAPINRYTLETYDEFYANDSDTSYFLDWSVKGKDTRYPSTILKTNTRIRQGAELRFTNDTTTSATDQSAPTLRRGDFSFSAGPSYLDIDLEHYVFRLTTGTPVDHVILMESGSLIGLGKDLIMAENDLARLDGETFIPGQLRPAKNITLETDITSLKAGELPIWWNAFKNTPEVLSTMTLRSTGNIEGGAATGIYQWEVVNNSTSITTGLANHLTTIKSGSKLTLTDTNFADSTLLRNEGTFGVNNNVVSAAVTGGGALAKTQTGVSVLATSQEAISGTTVEAGMLKRNKDVALQGNVVVNDGAKLYESTNTNTALAIDFGDERRPSTTSNTGTGGAGSSSDSGTAGGETGGNAGENTGSNTGGGSTEPGTTETPANALVTNSLVTTSASQPILRARLMTALSDTSASSSTVNYTHRTDGDLIVNAGGTYIMDAATVNNTNVYTQSFYSGNIKIYREAGKETKLFVNAKNLTKLDTTRLDAVLTAGGQISTLGGSATDKGFSIVTTNSLLFDFEQEVTDQVLSLVLKRTSVQPGGGGGGGGDQGGDDGDDNGHDGDDGGDQGGDDGHHDGGGDQGGGDQGGGDQGGGDQGGGDQGGDTPPEEPGDLEVIAKETGNTSLVDMAKDLDKIIDKELEGEHAPISGKFVPLTTNEEVVNALKETSPLLSGTVNRALMDAMSAMVKPFPWVRCPTDEGRHAWASAIGGWTNQGASAGAMGYDAHHEGVVAGADVCHNTWKLGGALAYVHSGIDSDHTTANHSAKSDAWMVGIYSDKVLSERWDIDFGAAVGRARVKGTRNITFAHETAKSTAHATLVTAGAGLNWHLGSKTLGWTPFVRADYQAVHMGNYTESGSVLALSVKKQTSESLVLRAGLKLSTETEKWDAFAKVSAGVDVLDDGYGITARFVNAPAAAQRDFTVENSRHGRAVGEVEVGGTYHVTPSVDLSAAVGTMVRKGRHDTDANLKVTVKF